MSQSPKRVTLPGSEKHALPGALAAGPIAPEERFEVTVRVRRKAPLPAPGAANYAQDVPPAERNYLSRDAYAHAHGSDPADIAKVEAFARAHNLVVVEASAPRRSVFLSGTVAAFEAAFGAKIAHYEHDGGTYRGRTGSLSVPADLADVVEGVFGIDDRPAAKPHFQRPRATPHAADGSFTPPQLAGLYDFPAGLNGTGQCIGIIELGGGFRTADLRAYFTGLGLPVPTVRTVRVDGGRNSPSNANSADGEVMLDIEVAAAVAPKATIVVYFTTNTDKGFLDAITAAVHDATNKPSVISISWGNPEKNWTAQSLSSFDQAFQGAARMGVTICCAAGDAGSGDENPDDLAQAGATPDGRAHADFPASSPNALACGGTKVTAAGGAIAAEVVWNEDPTRSATGGGVSDVFPPPSYQSAAHVPPSANPGGRVGRGLPDVAGDADPASGYQVRVDGQNLVIGGTSAVAPLWAGLIALMNQRLPRPVGFLNPLLYGSVAGKGAFRDITAGNNGAYSASAGWDACTGWGTPDGAKLLKALGG